MCRTIDDDYGYSAVMAAEAVNGQLAVGLRDIIEKIKAREVDIDELYADHHANWADFHLDELALVIAGEKVEKGSVIDNSDALYQQIRELSYLFSESSLKLLLRVKWIPLFTKQLQLCAAKGSSAWEPKVFRILHENEFLMLVAEQLRPILLPFVRELPDAYSWAKLLDYDLMDSIDLLQETISETAPQLSPQLLGIPHSNRIAAICLKVWAPTATAAQLAQIDLGEWSKFDITESDACDIFASALSSRWPLRQMAARYMVLSNFSIEQPNAVLEQAMVYTLNCINATMDRSGAEPPRTWKITQVSLERVLLDWCASQGIQVSTDLADRRKYTLSGASRVTIMIRDNVFWLNDQPIELEAIEELVSERASA